jgi:hypothetical protein
MQEHKFDVGNIWDGLHLSRLKTKPGASIGRRFGNAEVTFVGMTRAWPAFAVDEQLAKRWLFQETIRQLKAPYVSRGHLPAGEEPSAADTDCPWHFGLPGYGVEVSATILWLEDPRFAERVCAWLEADCYGLLRTVAERLTNQLLRP